MLSAILTLTACSPKPQIRYIDRPYKVYVPTKCHIPDVNCSFNKKTDTEVINSLLECIIKMKRSEEVCE